MAIPPLESRRAPFQRPALSKIAGPSPQLSKLRVKRPERTVYLTTPWAGFKESLARLKNGKVKILYLVMRDSTTPIESTLSAVHGARLFPMPPPPAMR